MFRGLSKMEEDPMIPQRMRDTIRTQICTAEAAAINDCGKEMVTLFFLSKFKYRVSQQVLDEKC